ncbi:3-deoxy-7-phosphoheptulonate synthase class II [Canibacter sp. lx-72]|uniref:class II 3-deoxy-7-phosphoheptulonate synthase n=1 Tax=Canibacter zhuwentaonis TaxID=2837491 RepID=UPI001BDCD927|nr:3-deoxy-7-phosphoheptulonate synthase class II [Canibacter zhuwentaonis]MBT1018235.1 3-deoxy-7-phosphoheptulonate synthase class II [Canibacter zhuwentaonis]MBT1035245.1 3-deoxy-7-phosphoheptulonate synthase class II [Canibacter zhuwentaonis]
MTVNFAHTALLKELDEYVNLTAKQQPHWEDKTELERVKKQLASQPPLVFAGEADSLRRQLADVAAGKAFLLQGGDCAETFAGATADKIRDRVKTVLQMALVLTYGGLLPVVKVGRMAGQFAKPRSSDVETRCGVTLPAFRGELVNGFEFTERARRADPERLLQGYNVAASTLNLIRAFTQGGFADLRKVHTWNQGFAENPANGRYRELAAEIDRAVRFMDACGAGNSEMSRTDFFVGHEALLLDYERPLTRVDSISGKIYDTSAHFLWIGERTRDLDGAHVDYLSKVANPIGVKLGPTTTVDDALALIDKLDPERIPGRLTFITRMGAGKIRDLLPPLLGALQDAEVTPVWVTDPMHGNGITTATGYKTRRFDDVMDEVQGFFEAHREVGTVPGGVHVELTGDDVTECLGGAAKIDEATLATRYESVCDPRLNHMQSLELAFLVAEQLRQEQF